MTIKLIDHLGRVIGLLTLPASTKLIDLEPLKKLGTARVEVLRDA